MVLDSVSKKFGIEKSIRFGIGKKLGIEKSIGFGIRNKMVLKKYRIRYRKYLVSQKVSDSEQEKTIKKSWIFMLETWFYQIWY